jgi:hypothetical protein
MITRKQHRVIRLIFWACPFGPGRANAPNLRTLVLNWLQVLIRCAAFRAFRFNPSRVPFILFNTYLLKLVSSIFFKTA